MNEDVQLIWEAYVIEDVDIGPPIEHHGEPGGLEHLDRPLAKHGDAFHQFLLDHGVHNPHTLELSPNRKIHFAFLMLQIKFSKMYDEKTKSYHIPKHFWVGKDGEITSYGKLLRTLGGRMPGSGPI